MATRKKAASKKVARPVKAVKATKTVAGKKSAAKKAGPSTARTDYKEGTRVKVVLKSGTHKGHVTKVESKSTGAFIHVNFGTKEFPVVKAVRPVNVSGY